MEPIRPFRWNVSRREQLGRLLDGVDEPPLWFLDDLIELAGKVLARSSDSRLYFVGRSVDSLYDILSGALAGTSWDDRLRPLPLSLYGMGGAAHATAASAHLRNYLTAAGLTPSSIMRGHPVALVDLVSAGSTFTNLFHLIKSWSLDEAGTDGGPQWDVVRRQLRFVGITERTKTSPNAWRWHQHQAWTAELPKSGIINVSIPWAVWSYFGNTQNKTTPSFWAERWSDPTVAEPSRTEVALAALAEAVALVEAGRTGEVRRRIAAVAADEPPIREAWLRGLVGELRS